MNIPTRALFGAGELNNLHKQVLPGKKALLVISNGRSTRANGYLERVVEQLAKAGVEYVLFDQVEANPLVGTVMAGGATAKEQGCDMIVALGGGSVIDAAKALQSWLRMAAIIGIIFQAAQEWANHWKTAPFLSSQFPLPQVQVRKQIPLALSQTIPRTKRPALDILPSIRYWL